MAVGAGQLLILGGALWATNRSHGQRLDRIEKRVYNGAFVSKEDLAAHSKGCRDLIDEKLDRLHEDVDEIKAKGRE